MACVKRRRNRWVVDFRDADGKRRWESYQTREEADTALGKRMEELKRGTYTAPSAVPTVRELAADWLEAKRAKHPATLLGYQTEMELHIVPALGDLEVTKVRVEHIDRFRNDLVKAGFAVSTINKLLTRTADLLRLGEKRNLIHNNPARLADRATATVSEVTIGAEDVDDENGAVDPSTVPNAPTVAKMLQHAPAGLYRTYLQTAAMTGGRPGELTALRWDHVDFDAKVIRIRRAVTWAQERGTKGPARPRYFPPKTKAGRRDIPIPSELVTALRVWKLACPPTEMGLVFPSDVASPKQRAAITRDGLKVAIKAAGLADFRLYALRHFYASALIASGELLPSIAKKMGHKNTTITQRVYLHYLEDPPNESKAVNALGAMLLPAEGAR